PLGWGEGFDPVHPGGLLAAVVLRDPADREVPRRPRREDQALELVDRAVIATTGGLVNALLEPEDRPLESLPGDARPVIRWRARRRDRRAHNPHSDSRPYRPLGRADVGVSWALPQALASSAILPGVRMRPTPAPPGGGERTPSYSVPHPRF